MSDVVAAARNLSIARGSKDGPVDVVADIALEVLPNEVVAVVGESGAGKTLTTKALLGLVPANLRSRGQIQLGSETLDLAATGHVKRDAALARLGSVVLQNPASMFDPLMQVGAQLVEATLFHRLATKAEAEEHADFLLTEVGFADPRIIKKLYPHQLSGGMAQRAAIAMSLMTQPKLLVVDEPTSALDANIRLEVMSLIARTADGTGNGVVLVTHDLPLAAQFATRVVVMYSGRIVEVGTAGDVMRNPEHPYTQSLLSSAVTLNSAHRTALKTVAGTTERPEERPSGCAFRLRCPIAIDDCAEGLPPLGRGPHQAACIRIMENAGGGHA
jgi:peptide/nickel transport system permease protein